MANHLDGTQPDPATEQPQDVEALIFAAAANGGANWIPADTTVVDVVASPSIRADGTADQTPGFIHLADPAAQ